MTHKELDNYLITEKSFNSRHGFKSNKNLSKKESLYFDPYYRFKRLLIFLEKYNLEFGKLKWIDLGCGPATFISILLNKFRVCNLTGIDQWDLKSEIDWLDFKYVCFNIEDDFTNSVDKDYDIISALEVLEHMIDTDKFLTKCKTILKKDGLLILTTPNINSLRNRLTVPFGTYPAPLEYKDIIRHVRIYNVPKLKIHLKEHKFEVIKIIGVNFLPTKLLQFSFFRLISEKVADWLPQFCPNICVIAKNIK